MQSPLRAGLRLPDVPARPFPPSIGGARLSLALVAVTAACGRSDLARRGMAPPVDPRTCAELQRQAPDLTSGAHALWPTPGTSFQVQCETTADEGGWTLVGASRDVPLNDELSDYYDDLATTAPVSAHAGIWGALRGVLPERCDLRFRCLGGERVVDLVFYQTDWYRSITRGTDADSCFWPEKDRVLPFFPPARRNLVTGDTLPRGDAYASGTFEGEDECGSADDFMVDFDEHGMDGNTDGTEWGEDDGGAYCGGATTAGLWTLWVREARPSCGDGAVDGDETDVDCGGLCGPCAAGEDCRDDHDCDSGRCGANGCLVPTCTDGLGNGEESDLDCGGPCAPCLDGARCAGDGDCLSRVCLGSRCAVPRCGDGFANGAETGTDCGGPCLPCPDAVGCRNPNDCVSGVCSAGVCLPPSCADGLPNGVETGTDCGGPCPACADGSGCTLAADCQSGHCSFGRCVPSSCADLARNGQETGVDCGGPLCAGCLSGEACALPRDCQGVCDALVCREARSCADILLLDPLAGDGLYTIAPSATSGAFRVLCDMSVDGGGWTLVASTAVERLDDAAGPHHDELQSLYPGAGHTAVWLGLRELSGMPRDIRFACRAEARSRANLYDVDLSVYDIHWYQEITAGDDAASCFNEGGGGYDQPAPARRNNLTGETRPLGDDWDQGFLEGEDSCGDGADFVIDFDQGGMDTGTDGTDWGDDDGSGRCGVPTSTGAWFIWVR